MRTTPRPNPLKNHTPNWPNLDSLHNYRGRLQHKSFIKLGHETYIIKLLMTDKFHKIVN